MKNIFKHSLFYFIVLSLVVGNNFVSISFDFGTKIARAQEQGFDLEHGKKGDKKITICHFPPGNEENPQTIEISESAWPAHQAHGDSIGQCPPPQSIPYPVPVVSAQFEPNGDVLVTWEVDSDDRFYQYKVVVSENNPNPVYPADGYMAPPIGDPNEKSRIVPKSGTYNGGDFDGSLDCGETYYFSVTARYDHPSTVNIAGNAVQLTVECSPVSICGNGIVEGNEVCDDSNTNNEYCGDEVVQSGTYCSADCSQELVLDEQCDAGLNGSQTCTSQCTLIEVEEEECTDENNLIINGSFEEPVVTNSELWQKMASVNAWDIKKVSDNSATTLELHKGWSGNVAAEGLQYAELDGDHSTLIAQNVAVQSGAQYKLFWSFAPRHGIAAEQNHLAVELDGTQVATNGPATGNAPLAQDDWTASSYVFTADNSNVEIGFKDIGPSNSYGTYVDNVRLCKIADPEPEPEPETPYAPWCSALYGALQGYFDPAAPAYLLYNDVIDINNDQVIDLLDIKLVTDLYNAGNDENCYYNFENPTSEVREFYFQCEDPNVGWCDALIQGLKDSYGAKKGDDNYSLMYDLNDDGVINLTDLSMMAQLYHGGDHVACYVHFVPPFEMCELPEPECGNGILEEGEYCDGQAGVPEGYTCSDQCTLVQDNPPQPPVCVGSCGGGSNPADVSNVLATASCENTQITWNTSKDSLTWIVYGPTNSLGSEYKDTDYKSSHSFTPDSLAAGTTYYYQIKTQSVDNKTSQDALRSFTTPSAEQCGQVLGEKVEEEPIDNSQPEQEVLGVKEYVCNFMRPSHSQGVDKDILGVFNFPDGTLIRHECDPQMRVYVIRDQQRWHVPTWDYLNKNYRGKRIYNVDHTAFDLYPEWTGKVSGVKEYPDGSLLRSKDKKVYVILNGKKNYISSLDELKKYAGQQIFDVSDEVLNQY